MPDTGYPLFCAEPSSAWHLYPQQSIAAWTQQNALPILPVYSLTERTPESPLDLEEQLAGPLLKAALQQLPGSYRFPVLPPLRHLPAQWPGQCFTLPAQEAWRVVEDLIASVAQSGFKRLLILHAHPLLADWLDCVLRDARIATGLSLYRISLEAAGLTPEPSASSADVNPADRLAHLLTEVYHHSPREASQ